MFTNGRASAIDGAPVEELRAVVLVLAANPATLGDWKNTLNLLDTLAAAVAEQLVAGDATAQASTLFTLIVSGVGPVSTYA
jgi:hypothetical protein